jgi:two-component system cell cycle sensor histidine kinase/response regulator CckA
MAESPEHADRMFEQHADAVDILITDVIMPGSTGPALFRRLAKIRPSLKVLYMSGYSDDAIAPGGQLDPDVAFLQKPFSATALMQKVRDVLTQD